jgi:uncharacterized protein (DUF927 family)
MQDTTYFNLCDNEGSAAAPAANQIQEQAIQRFPLVFFNSEVDRFPKSQEPIWTEFITTFGTHKIRTRKEGSPAWSPVSYKNGTTRGNANVESISMLVADIDDGQAFDEIKPKLDGYSYLAHSSFSHSLEQPKYRVILPLSQPVPVADWPLIWAQFNAFLGGINDPATKDPARIYFLPCHPKDAPGHFVEVGEGALLDIIELPELPVESVTAVTRSSNKNYSKVIIEGIEEVPADPLNPAEGLSRVVERCAFMQWVSAIDNQNNVSYPLWWAMVSNASRFEESEVWIHQASCHHDGYKESATDRLIGSCIEFQRPITCETIQGYGFSGCPTEGCKKRSGDGVTMAPAGLWMNGVSKTVNHVPMPTVLTADGIEQQNGDDGRYVGQFYVSQEGVFKVSFKDGEEKHDKIASYIDIAAQTRDAVGSNWGLLVAVKDPDGNMHEWAMPREMLPNPSTWKSELFKMGADIYQGGKQDYLYEYFLDAKPTARAMCVMQPGWYQGVFVLPNRVIGNATTERVVLQTTDLEATDVYRSNGTLAEWQEHVGASCVGNSRLITVICAALAGPTLHLLGEENGGFHLVGGSSIGKTTAVEVAASVWGNRNKFVRNWRTTGNAAESIATRHNDTLLILDEISQVSPFEAGEIAYMLGNGRGKSRSTVSGTARGIAQWRLMFLSTGEQSLAEHMQSAGKRIMAGQEVRLVNLPADAGTGFGLFENIHGSPSPQQFATQLKATTAEYYGQAGPALIEALADPEQQPELLETIRNDVEVFVNNYVPASSCGQVLRVGKRFALLAAVGEMATCLGILPWSEGEAISAARTCFHAWIDGRGGVANQEADQAIAQVRRFLETHGESRFRDWNDASDNNADGRTINRAGFRRVSDDDHRTEYYILPEVFKTEICAGLNPKEVVKALREGGFLVVGGDGKSTKQERLPGIGPKKVYRLNPDILGDAD